MAWYLDSTRIFVQDINEDVKQVIARLKPLGDGTVLHVFGYEDDIYKVPVIVVGDTDKEAIKNMTKDGVTHTFTYPDASTKTVLINSASVKNMRSICQSMRPDLPEDSPVYTIDLEFYL